MSESLITLPLPASRVGSQSVSPPRKRRQEAEDAEQEEPSPSPTLASWRSLIRESAHSSIIFHRQPAPTTMFELFQRTNTAASPHAPLPRAMSSSDVLDAPTTETPSRSLRKCTSVVRPLTVSGWGIVPVLNEIEGRGPSRLRRPPSAKRQPCANCGQLFFVGDCRPRELPVAFCSLDCRSSHQYSEDMQEIVDARLQRGHASSHRSSSTLSEEDEDVVALDDDELLVEWK